MAADGQENKLLTEIGRRDWTNLPEDLLTSILSCLYLDDVKQFHDVCRTWRQVEDPKHHSPLRCPVAQSQWLMNKMPDQSKCKFFHPLYGDTYSVDIPELRGAAIRFSRDGWLLMSRGDYEIFFFNPFSKTKIELPDLSERYNFRGITFTSKPISSDCMVVGITAYFDVRVSISTISHGDQEWNDREFQNNLPIFPSPCNPIFHKEKFYCLGQKGSLGVFDPNNDKWIVLDSPQKQYGYIRENYLVDCDGELMSVFMESLGSQIYVFKLDETKMEWEEVKDMGENMLFVGVTTSFSRKKVIDQMKNKIYFPIFHRNNSVFYSLDTCRYQTFGSDFNSESLYDTWAQLACCWIEPSQDHYSEEQLKWFSDSDLSSESDDSAGSSDTSRASESDSAYSSDASSESDNYE